MFYQIEISVLDRTENMETLGVKISRNGVRPEATMMLSGPFNLRGCGLRPKEKSIEAVLKAVRGTLRCGDRILPGHLLDFANNIQAPVVVRVRQD
jgi:hypothetical protein